MCGIVEIVGDLAGHGNATDNDFLHRWEIRPGLKTVADGMQWQAPVGVAGGTN